MTFLSDTILMIAARIYWQVALGAGIVAATAYALNRLLKPYVVSAYDRCPARVATYIKRFAHLTKRSLPLKHCMRMHPRHSMQVASPSLRLLMRACLRCLPFSLQVDSVTGQQVSLHTGRRRGHGRQAGGGDTGDIA